ncbi:guanine nucleotide-exchange factor SEC12-like [Littorina saxatilis]|uniref:Prolactin regulatory element-binding protein n=1 Tax=Littorina saxatilis TaxID=31220 RepID=A0AAN9G9I9_9CAEN
MAPARDVLAQSDFPLYAVQALGSTHFLVAGGGGQAKTGVPNVIEIFELKQREDKVLASSICRHDTGTDAVMNCASFYDGRNHFIACGQEEKCHLYSVKYKVITPKKESSETNTGDAKKRKGKADKDDKANSEKKADANSKTPNGTKQLTFELECLKSVQTDFEKDGGFQKVVRFSLDRTLVITGGAEGFLRLWKYPEMKMAYETKAHKSDIDDLDISPSGDKIVTVSRDNTGCVWNTKNGTKHSDLVWDYSEAAQYRYRCCRYGSIENKKDKFNLYTVSIPIKRSSSNPQPCFILMWDKDTFKVKRGTNAGTEVLSALAVSDDGVYLGVGSISGSVSVYISFSLKKLYHVKEAHSIFVTGLEFLPASEATQAIVGQQDFSLLSVSADNTVRLHQAPERGFISIVWILAVVILLIFILFWMMAEMGV